MDETRHTDAAPHEPAPRRTIRFSPRGPQTAARGRHARRQAETPGTGQRRRIPRWRIVVWCLEAAILLGVLEVAVCRRRERPPKAPPAAAAGTPAALVPALGEGAVPLAGLLEVPSLLVPLDGLASGSETMREAQLAFSRAGGLPVEVANSIGMRLRLVPPGTALVGSPSGEVGRGEGEVQHVTLVPAPFYLGTYEVTQAEWNRLMPRNPSHFPGDDHPVEEVTWYDCQRFLNELSRREGVEAGTYRLPTETEWEYACRAGTQTAFHCGDDAVSLAAFAEYAEINYRGTTPVGRKRANALGLHNLHGNVWEWCLNRFGPYPGDSRPMAAEMRDWRCIRGGNWYVPALDCRSAERSRLPPSSQGNMLGFRVLRSIPEWTGGAPPAPSPAPAEEGQGPGPTLGD